MKTFQLSSTVQRVRASRRYGKYWKRIFEHVPLVISGFVTIFVTIAGLSFSAFQVRWQTETNLKIAQLQNDTAMRKQGEDVELQKAKIASDLLHELLGPDSKHRPVVLLMIQPYITKELYLQLCTAIAQADISPIVRTVAIRQLSGVQSKESRSALQQISRNPLSPVQDREAARLGLIESPPVQPDLSAAAELANLAEKAREVAMSINYRDSFSGFEERNIDQTERLRTSNVAPWTSGGNYDDQGLKAFGAPIQRRVDRFRGFIPEMTKTRNAAVIALNYSKKKLEDDDISYNRLVEDASSPIPEFKNSAERVTATKRVDERIGAVGGYFEKLGTALAQKRKELSMRSAPTK